MNNCIILGSPRSGTSLCAGMLAKSGFFMGDDYIAPRAANPKGYFEDSVVNRLNDAIISHSIYSFWSDLWRYITRKPRKNKHWLTILQSNRQVVMPSNAEGIIQERLSHVPFCYKDPRFSYTLSAWRPYLPEDTRMLVVFRDPRKTAESLLYEKTDKIQKLNHVRLNFGIAGEVWYSMYRNILDRMDDRSRYIFVHSDHLIDFSSCSLIERHLNVSLDKSFPDKRVSRTQHATLPKMKPHWQRLYDELKSLECHQDKVSHASLLR